MAITRYIGLHNRPGKVDFLFPISHLLNFGVGGGHYLFLKFSNLELFISISPSWQNTGSNLKDNKEATKNLNRNSSDYNSHANKRAWLFENTVMEVEGAVFY